MRMLRICIGLSLLSMLLLVSCNRKNAEIEEAQRRTADSIAIVQARADSLMRVTDSLKRIEMEREKARTAEIEAKQRLKFHVIKGSFVYQNNADRFLDLQQRSYPEAKQFVAPNGFKLVSIADFGSMDEAVAYINRNGGSDLWVFEEGGPYNTSSWINSDRSSSSSAPSSTSKGTISDDSDIVVF